MSLFFSSFTLLTPPPPTPPLQGCQIPVLPALLSSLLLLTLSVWFPSSALSSLRVTVCLPGRSVRSAKVRQLKWRQIGTVWENNRVNGGRASRWAGRRWQQNVLIVSKCWVSEAAAPQILATQDVEQNVHNKTLKRRVFTVGYRPASATKVWPKNLMNPSLFQCKIHPHSLAQNTHYFTSVWMTIHMEVPLQYPFQHRSVLRIWPNNF